MKLNGQFCQVQLDDSVPTIRDVSKDVSSIDIPDEYGELDTTAFMDGAVRSMAGMPSFPVEIAGDFDPAVNSLFQVAKSIVGKSGATSYTLIVDVGQGVAPVTGDPRFTGEFWCSKLGIAATPQGKITLAVSLRPVTAVAPGWTTKP